MHPAPRRLALFDLDGTLTRRDTYGLFVAGLLWRLPGRWIRVPLLLGPLLGYAVGRLDRGDLKGAILHLLFAGLDRARIDAWAEAHVARTLRREMLADAVAALKGHLAAGDHVVVLSASPDLYVPRLASALGAHEAHCTAIRWQGERLDGRLAGPNRRDAEKVRVLEALRAAHPGLPVIAYGNSTPDLPHMRLCEEAVYVNPGPARAAELNREGIRCVHWRHTGSR